MTAGNYSQREYQEIIKDFTGNGSDLEKLVGYLGSVTQLNYIADLTSSAQTQITNLGNDKLDKTSGLQIASTGLITVPFADINADDGTGIKVSSVTLNGNYYIEKVIVSIEQDDNSTDNTLDVIINDTDDNVSPTQTLLSGKLIDGTKKYIYQPVDGDSTLGITSSTHKYVVLVAKDVNNNGDATQDLKVRMMVFYYTIV